MELEANCMTTAMGIMPHRDIDRALKLALSLDIPFWPQLPNVSFYEDMYAQASEHFPGIAVDAAASKVSFDNSRFQEEVVSSYAEMLGQPEAFSLSQRYSLVYHRFLSQDLECCAAIRGQMTGPVSFGFRVVDENQRPIIYNEDVRALLFEFIQKKVNTQYRELSQKNRRALVWLDEPGLGWVFSGFTGYSDVKARQDYLEFMAGMEGPRALHLCANINLPYLLELGIELLSFDAYQIEAMPRGYATAIGEFLKRGGIICWGIVPTDSDNLGRESVESLVRRITVYWEVVSRNSGLPMKQVARQALLAPARCCLKNIGKVGAADDARAADTTCVAGGIEERLVEQAFAHLKEMSRRLRARYGLEW